MDPINNQQQGNPQQEIVQPQNTTQAVQPQTAQYQSPNKGRSSRGTTILLLVILLILILGLVGYLIYVNSRSNYSQNIPVTNSNFSSPTSVPVPSIPQSVIDDFDLEDPETDIKALDTDAQNL